MFEYLVFDLNMFIKYIIFKLFEYSHTPKKHDMLVVFFLIVSSFIMFFLLVAISNANKFTDLCLQNVCFLCNL